jgi:hypothetical protein
VAVRQLYSSAQTTASQVATTSIALRRATLTGRPQKVGIGRQWLQARDSGSDLGSVGEPEVELISTFEGGEIAVTFKRSADGTGYEIGTIFPRVSRDV